jgi:hypothetical protein
MTKGGNLTEQSSRHIHSGDRREAQHHGLFRAAGQLAEDQHAAGRPIASGASAQPSWDVFSHASEYDVMEQQRSDAQHDEVAMRSLRHPFNFEVDMVDAIDQGRSVPVDEDDYR